MGGLPANFVQRSRITAKILLSEGIHWLWPFTDRAELNEPTTPATEFNEAFDAETLGFEERMKERLEQASAMTHRDLKLGEGVLAYVNSHNQLGALEPTLRALSSKLPCHVIADSDMLHDFGGLEVEEIFPFRKRASESALRFSHDYAPLVREIAYREAVVKPRAVFDVIYHVFSAIELLTALSPRILLVSNDHLTVHRTLIAVARLLGVRTAYVQHASVSSLFPKLDFDYAFLDGMSSYLTYADCEKNASRYSTISQNPRIFLTGQKKAIEPRDPQSRGIGIAVNLLDDIATVEALAERLAAQDRTVIVRWHPRQDNDVVERLTALARRYPDRMTVSDPKKEEVSNFLAKVRAIVAGDSSILLEGAVAGCTPVYHRTSNRIENDYYNFVRIGLAAAALNADEVEAAIDSPPPRDSAIRHFSATYGTKWFGHEGELVAATLERIIAGASLDDLYLATQSRPVTVKVD